MCILHSYIHYICCKQPQYMRTWCWCIGSLSNSSYRFSYLTFVSSHSHPSETSITSPTPAASAPFSCIILIVNVLPGSTFPPMLPLHHPTPLLVSLGCPLAFLLSFTLLSHTSLLEYLLCFSFSLYLSCTLQPLFPSLIFLLSSNSSIFRLIFSDGCSDGNDNGDVGLGDDNGYQIEKIYILSFQIG